MAYPKRESIGDTLWEEKGRVWSSRALSVVPVRRFPTGSRSLS